MAVHLVVLIRSWSQATASRSSTGSKLANYEMDIGMLTGTVAMTPLAPPSLMICTWHSGYDILFQFPSAGGSLVGRCQS